MADLNQRGCVFSLRGDRDRLHLLQRVGVERADGKLLALRASNPG
jgi:hypothetical protein